MNTALNRTSIAYLTNKSGGALTYGAVVVLDNTNSNGFTTTTSSGLATRGLGVILDVAGIANNATGAVAIGGWCPQINLNTSSTVGQFIKTHTVAGQGTPHASPQVEGDFAVALTASATPSAMLFGSPNGPSGNTIAWAPPVGLRLSASTNTYLPTTDITAASTLYWTPILSGGSGVVVGYDGVSLARKTVTQKSLALSGLSSGANYNVYYDYDGDALALGAVWTNATTPSETLADESGAPVLSSDHTKLYLGVIRTTSTTTTEDSGGIAGTTLVGGKRFVWNAWNQARRTLSVVDKTDTWAYATNTVRQADGNAGNQVEYVTGDSATTVEAVAVGSVLLVLNSVNAAKIGIGIDSTTAFSGLVQEVFNGVNSSCIYPLMGRYLGQPGIGYHYVAWLESGATTGTCTFRGDNAGDGCQSGLHATIFG